MRFSVVVPVYLNAESIPRLVDALTSLSRALEGQMEAVLVVDGSPDASFSMLQERLGSLEFPTQLLAHSKNFGSFAAIRTGLKHARGEFTGVLSADLQEPPELLLRFFAALDADECDVTVGARDRRSDPFLSGVGSRLFWRIYRSLVVPEVPVGGVDVFACNNRFREQLLQLEESRSSLVALIFWLGFRRKEFTYDRLERQEGKSAWSFRKKLDYMNDSIFAFTDLPVRWLMRIGIVGVAICIALGAVVLAARLLGYITVPGYTMTLLVVILFGTLNLLGLGIVGAYAWRAYENSKQRPSALVAVITDNFNEGAQ